MKEQKNVSADLIARAMKDTAFRQALLADPRRVIEQETGMALPEGVEIQVMEETPTVRYLVLPPLPEASDELSDAELETAAAGVVLSGPGGGVAICSLSGTCKGPDC